MNTGSRDEQMMLANLKRAADALERAADMLERQAKASERVADVVEEVAATWPRPRP
jgi:hypothetical protein